MAGGVQRLTYGKGIFRQRIQRPCQLVEKNTLAGQTTVRSGGTLETVRPPYGRRQCA